MVLRPTSLIDPSLCIRNSDDPLAFMSHVDEEVTIIAQDARFTG